MKRILLILGAGLLLTAPGACNCEGEKAPEVKAPESKKASEKPTKKEPEKKAPEKKDAAKKTDDDKDGTKKDAPKDAPASAVADGDAKPADADAGAAGGDEKPDGDKVADGAESQPADGDAKAPTEPADAEKDAEKDAAAIKAAEAKNPMDEVEPGGGVYEGPPGKAIIGTWSVSVSKAGLPTGLPEDLQKEIKAIKKITMKFDGKKATIDLGKGKKNTLNYTVKEDSKISATLTTKAGEEAGSVQVTFLDNDNILINSTSFPVQMKGKRKK